MLETIRAACATVMEGARHVRLEPRALEGLADRLRDEPASLAPGAGAPDPTHHRRGSDAETLAFVLTMDAINFGSGWFPVLRKRPGMSGYFTVSTALSEHFDARGAWSADELAALDGAEVARVLGQDRGVPDVAELMDHYAAALRQLGAFLAGGYAGRFAGPVEEAGGSAAALVGILARMPYFDDAASWRGRPVPFYKRAQITAGDLDQAFGGRGWGAFRDLDRLTAFADNLVPHVLRCEGVLVYAEELAARIDRQEPLAAGSEEEVEIRAGGVHAVELLGERLRARGVVTTSSALDYRLWAAGQAPAFKARPRHRARSVYY